MKMGTKQITAQDFKTWIQTGVSLIDFNAPWCGPCRAQEPIIEQLADRYDGKAVIAQMNVDDNQETAIALGIQSIPTLALFKDGKEIKRFVGLQSSKTLEQALEDSIDE
jgi:thioredoxin 1